MRVAPPRTGEILAGAFGALLALSLFLPWYRETRVGTSACPPGTDCPGGGVTTTTAFEAFAILDVFLLAVAAAGMALLLAGMTQRTPAIPVAWAAIATLLGLVAVPLVLWRTLAPPGGPGSEPVFALLGLAACAGLTIGCLVSIRDEGAGAAQRSRPGAPPERLAVLPVQGDGEGAGGG